MIKAKLNCVPATLAAALLIAFAGQPALAQKQKDDTPPVAFGDNAPKKDEDEEKAPAAGKVYAAINYDVNADPDNIWVLDLSNGQRVKIRLMPDWAPGHVERIKELSRRGFYNGVIFHRVIDGFMAQGGDPTGTGMGGSDKPDLAAEFNAEPHVRGVCSMARSSNPNSANSQFFICFDDARFLDRQYTVWGQVTSGMEHVDALPKGEPPAKPGKIVKATVA